MEMGVRIEMEGSWDGRDGGYRDGVRMEKGW
jgi:hypothetical protein